MLKKGDFIPGVIATAFGIVVTFLTLTGDKMNLMIKNVPGQGFFPLICGVLLIIFGIVLTIKGIRQHGTVSYTEMTPEIKENIKTALLFLVGLIAVLILWKVTNLFILCVPLFAAYLCVLLKRSWVFTLIFTVVITAFIYLLFMQVFSVTFKV